MADRLVHDVAAEVVSVDDGNGYIANPVKACADNHIRALTLLWQGPRADWVVVLEDDAQPVPNFRHHVSVALQWAETSIVGLYLGTGNPNGPTQQAIIPAVREADDVDIPWIVGDWFISTVGYAVRWECLPYLIETLSELVGPIDNRINTWTHMVDLPTWYTQPSLVDHEDGPSVISSPGIPNYENIKTRRRAHRFGTRSEWGSRTVKLGYAEGWSR
jgi:hypothetical protein